MGEIPKFHLRSSPNQHCILNLATESFNTRIEIGFGTRGFLRNLLLGGLHSGVGLGTRFGDCLRLLLRPLTPQRLVFLMEFRAGYVKRMFKFGTLLFGGFEGMLGELADTFGRSPALLQNPGHRPEEDVFQIDGQQGKKDDRRNRL
jgi:hypothetical protein